MTNSHFYGLKILLSTEMFHTYKIVLQQKSLENLPGFLELLPTSMIHTHTQTHAHTEQNKKKKHHVKETNTIKNLFQSKFCQNIVFNKLNYAATRSNIEDDRISYERTFFKFGNSTKPIRFQLEF